VERELYASLLPNCDIKLRNWHNMCKIFCLTLYVVQLFSVKTTTFRKFLILPFSRNRWLNKTHTRYVLLGRRAKFVVEECETDT
jgi:hypothetical protein